MIPSKLSICLSHQRLRMKRHLSRLFHISLTTERIFGLKIAFFNYKVFTSLFRQMFITREYYFQTSTREPFIIDCGSNIGLSVLYFKLLYPSSSILAFEPDPATFVVLEANIKRNALPGIILHNMALAGGKKKVEFHIDSASPGSLKMSIFPRKHNQNASISVQATLLSSYVDRQVDFLKMDIEGAEDEVILDLAVKDKLRFISQMVLEYHHHMNLKNDKLSGILKLLEDHGFGYQIHSCLQRPFNKDQFQDIMIYAYRK